MQMAEFSGQELSCPLWRQPGGKQQNGMQIGPVRVYETAEESVYLSGMRWNHIPA